MATKKGKAKAMKATLKTAPPPATKSHAEKLAAQGFVPTSEVVAKLNISGTSVRNWIQEGKVESVLIGARWFVRWQSVLDHYRQADPRALELLGLK